MVRVIVPAHRPTTEIRQQASIYQSCLGQKQWEANQIPLAACTEEFHAATRHHHHQSRLHQLMTTKQRSCWHPLVKLPLARCPSPLRRHHTNASRHATSRRRRTGLGAGTLGSLSGHADGHVRSELLQPVPTPRAVVPCGRRRVVSCLVEHGAETKGREANAHSRKLATGFGLQPNARGIFTLLTAKRFECWSGCQKNDPDYCFFAFFLCVWESWELWSCRRTTYFAHVRTWSTRSL